ncbi:MAG: hypothetical protein ACI4RM_08420, partial [Ruminococcus sp.]
AQDINKVKRRVLLDNFIYAPVSDGDRIGRIIYTLNNEVIAEHSIIAVSYNNKKDNNFFEYIKGFFNNAI